MSISRKIRFLVLERDDHTCQYCGLKPTDGIKLEIDHKVPVSKGGSNSMENLITSCFDCNRGKRDYLNLTKVDINELTPEIAHNIIPIWRKLSSKGIDKTKVHDREYLNSDEVYKLKVRNDMIMAKTFGLKNNISVLCKYQERLLDLNDQYYKNNYVELKPLDKHLEIYIKYHGLSSAYDVALKLIEDCLIPKKFFIKNKT